MIEVLGLLTTATAFGGIVLNSFGFAQLVFCALFGGEAGRLNRLAFSYYLFVIAAAALGGLLSVPLNPLSAALMAAIAFVGVYAH